jgi:hypothetical protein
MGKMKENKKINKNNEVDNIEIELGNNKTNISELKKKKTIVKLASIDQLTLLVKTEEKDYFTIFFTEKLYKYNNFTKA